MVRRPIEFALDPFELCLDLEPILIGRTGR
jgi:hypothetical protein